MELICKSCRIKNKWKNPEYRKNHINKVSKKIKELWTTIEICGFFIDGYDKENNIVFEYDEPQHYYVNGRLKEKDLYRQNVLIEHISKQFKSPRFIRYDEKRNRLYEVLIGKEVTYGKKADLF